MTNININFNKDIDLQILENAINASTVTNVIIKIKVNSDRKRVVLTTKPTLYKQSAPDMYISTVKAFVTSMGGIVNKNDLAKHLSSTFKLKETTAYTYISFMVTDKILVKSAKKMLTLVTEE